jgi:hypothetical protein
MFLLVLGCPKKEEPPSQRYEIESNDFPDNDDLDDLPEADTGLEE